MCHYKKKHNLTKSIIKGIFARNCQQSYLHQENNICWFRETLLLFLRKRCWKPGEVKARESKTQLVTPEWGGGYFQVSRSGYHEKKKKLGFGLVNTKEKEKEKRIWKRNYQRHCNKWYIVICKIYYYTDCDKSWQEYGALFSVNCVIISLIFGSFSHVLTTIFHAVIWHLISTRVIIDWQVSMILWHNRGEPIVLSSFIILIRKPAISSYH